MMAGLGLTYFKRFRMEIDLPGRDFAAPLPAGYRFVGWNDALLDAFAETKFHCFRNEMDTNVFPCLGELAGCRRLMHDIVRKPGFLPQATWLVAHTPPGRRQYRYCGTVQGVRDPVGMGAIQNLGIVPDYRGGGLGTMLLFRALEGFRDSGIKRVHLEVTAQNDGAIRLYRRLGFTTVKTVFKAAENAFV
jgi:ribosomal protein S18 acetylase RimI-like enzyme